MDDFESDYEQEGQEESRQMPIAPSPMDDVEIPKLTLGKSVEFLGTKNLKREADYFQKEVRFSQHNFEDKFREFESILTTIDDAIRNNDSRITEIKKGLDDSVKVREVLRLASGGDPWFQNYEKLNDIAKAMVENNSLRAWQIEIVSILTKHMMKLVEEMRKESRESVVGKYIEGLREKEKKIEDTLTMKMMENFERMMNKEREFSEKRIASLLGDKGIIQNADDNGHAGESQKKDGEPVDKETELKRREALKHIKERPGSTRNELRRVVGTITIVDDLVKENMLDVDSTPKNLGDYRYYIFGHLPDDKQVSE